MPLQRLTRQTLVNLTVEGRPPEYPQFQFGDWSPTGAYRNTTAFRVAAQQGQKRLMTHFFGVDEAVYDVQGAGISCRTLKNTSARTTVRAISTTS